MSTAVAETPATTEPRAIRHVQDRGILVGFGADVNDTAMIDEYFEYRDSFGRPGPLDMATLHRLAVESRRRATKKKGK